MRSRSSMVVAILQTHPNTALSPNRAASTPTCLMPLRTGRLIVAGLTAEGHVVKPCIERVRLDRQQHDVEGAVEIGGGNEGFGVSVKSPFRAGDL